MDKYWYKYINKKKNQKYCQILKYWVTVLTANCQYCSRLRPIVRILVANTNQTCQRIIYRHYYQQQSLHRHTHTQSHFGYVHVSKTQYDRESVLCMIQILCTHTHRHCVIENTLWSIHRISACESLVRGPSIYI